MAHNRSCLIASAWRERERERKKVKKKEEKINNE
jgi:hypothetical protein